MKKIIFIIVVAVCCFFAIMPKNEISIISHDTENVITWDFSGRAADHDDVIIKEYFFSYERYITGDLNDRLYIGLHNKSYLQPVTKEFLNWHVFVIEYWRDVDSQWLNIELGF